MSKVKLLDSNTINKIAAGEVVERPASCVKELVENSIDAGATRIEIEIQNGGKSFIRITDNGIGMNHEDASLAIRRHATSKIKSVDDLFEVSTLGFRGEALPTITSVSKFLMRTRSEGSELGTLIKVEGGIDKDFQEIGCALGTTIQVEDLFFNTPARKKFLKTPNTEGTKIHDYVVKLALSRPSISFKFINGNRNAITTPGNGDLFDTITSIYGREISDSLLKIDFTDKVDPNFKISGYISKPNVLKSYRSWQTFIVNGRIISSRIISKAVDEAYKAMIPKSGYPLAILIFDMPSLSVDVNVHPQKTEIRFADENNLYRAVYAAVTQSIDEKTFADANSNDDLQNVAVTPTFSRQNNFSYQRPQNFSQRSRSFNNGIDNTLKILDNYSAKFSNDEIDLPQENFSSETTIDQIATNEKTSTKKITPIGQVDLCYIIAKTDDGLYIVDQHAAHERILFDRLCGYTDGIPAQQLLVHQILNFDDHESKLVEDNLELFHKLGFTMEPSGENEYRLIEIPADIEISDAENLLREILSNLPPIDESIAAEDQQKAIAKNIRQECLAMTACKAAIKSGMELNFRQMQMILEQLEQTSHPFTCPHGRPTIIKFSSNDLAKMFKRTGF
ncbi:MAG: DNA mismatch repair endonuclease MutL [Selenomonadaceae bacterium]|nr:DNA mismatch repair endonuclease MutL [Selenomonadaceae bacterium]